MVLSVGSLVQQVRLGSEEQERGIEQIAKAVSQMERVTQHIAASAEEGAAAGEELRKHASTVGRTVDSLQALVGQEAIQRKQPVRKAPVQPKPAAHSKPALTGNRLESTRFTSPSTTPATQYQTAHQAVQSSNVGVMEKKDPFPMDDGFEEF